MNNQQRAAFYTAAGGPAFPLADIPAGAVYGGMTLRDYFAARALVLFPAAADAKTLAEASYEVADAMLKAREV